MRARFLILPAMFGLVACSQSNDDKLRVLHNLVPHAETDAEKKFAKDITFERCLDLKGLINAIEKQGTSEVTVYVNDIEFDNADDGKALTDVKIGSAQALGSAGPLIESFPPNRLGESQILKDYLFNSLEQDRCTSITIGGKEFVPQGLMDSSTTSSRTRRRLANGQLSTQTQDDSQTQTKEFKSPSRFKLDLAAKDGTDSIVFRVAGGVLTITARTANPNTVDTCDAKVKDVKNVIKKEIQVVFGSRVNAAVVKSGFYSLLVQNLNPEVVTDDLKDLEKVKNNKGAIVVDTRNLSRLITTQVVSLDYSQLASLSNAVEAGLFKGNQCKK